MDDKKPLPDWLTTTIALLLVLITFGFLAVCLVAFARLVL